MNLELKKLKMFLQKLKEPVQMTRWYLYVLLWMNYLLFNDVLFSIQFEVPTSDFIELYTNEIAMLKQKIEIMTKKYEDVSNEVMP